MVADALVTSVTRSSAGMVLTVMLKVDDWVNTMATDALATQGARASTAMVLTVMLKVDD